MKKKIEGQEQKVKNGEQKELPSRSYGSPGYGPTVYTDQFRGRVVDEVDALRGVAWELTDYLHGQWDDGHGDAHQMETTVSALLDVILMWQARVPTEFDVQMDERAAKDAEAAVRS